MEQKVGEFGFINHIKELFSTASTNGCEGIGDDCAIIPTSDDTSLVVTCDMLTQGSHFLFPGISAYDLGYKSLAVSLSDVAAMGAVPIASFLSIALPMDCGKEFQEEFMAGYHDLSRDAGVALLGGDTVTSKEHITVNVTAIGKVKNKNIKRRAAATPNQKIYVSAELGDSAVGLDSILNSRPCHQSQLLAHYRPSPHIEQGAWLGTRAEVTAMMDISDGVASDLRHILNLSGVGATIDHIPTSNLTTQYCQQHGIPIVQIALATGEDYKLLFTVNSDTATQFEQAYYDRFGTPPLAIGYTHTNLGLYIKEGDSITPLTIYGYRHQ